MNALNKGSQTHVCSVVRNLLGKPATSRVRYLSASLDHDTVQHFLRGGTPNDPAPPPFNLAEIGEDSLYTLVLLRHGESEWNAENRYTGWHDVNLAKQGEKEAAEAGRFLVDNEIELDQAFTSLLKRAINSTEIVLNSASQHWVPVTKSWRLNERHYGALTGYKKDTAWKELNLDQEVVVQMRRSYDIRPPRMDDNHTFWHGNDRRYKQLSKEQFEQTRAESLKDTADRVLPFFHSVIVPSLRSGSKCLMVSHANTLRTLIKHIDGISDEGVKALSIPTGIPMLYRLDRDLQPVDAVTELGPRYSIEPRGYAWGTSRDCGFSGSFLGSNARFDQIHKKKDDKHRDWQRVILLKLVNKMIKNLMPGVEKVVNKEDEYRVGTIHILEQLEYKMMEQPEYSKMMLLIEMTKRLKELVQYEKQHLTTREYEEIVDSLYQEAEGKVVDSFLPIKEYLASEDPWYSYDNNEREAAIAK